jgi:hypothetical protein
MKKICRILDIGMINSYTHNEFGFSVGVRDPILREKSNIQNKAQSMDTFSRRMKAQ